MYTITHNKFVNLVAPTLKKGQILVKNQMSKMNASIELGGASFVLALDQAKVTA